MLSAVFKGLYRGQGIYWHGADGYGDETKVLGTIADCRAAIDRAAELREQAERNQFQAAELKGYRDGDNARIEYKGKPVFIGTMREARRQVFTLEEVYAADIAWQ